MVKRRCGVMDLAGCGAALRDRYGKRAATATDDLEKWLWQDQEDSHRGGEPAKLRLSTPYYLLRKDIDRFLAAFDEYPLTQADQNRQRWAFGTSTPDDINLEIEKIGKLTA